MTKEEFIKKAKEAGCSNAYILNCIAEYNRLKKLGANIDYSFFQIINTPDAT